MFNLPTSSSVVRSTSPSIPFQEKSKPESTPTLSDSEPKVMTPNGDISALNHAIAKIKLLEQSSSVMSGYSDEKKDERVLARQQLLGSLNGIKSRNIELSPEQKQAIQDGFNSSLQSGGELLSNTFSSKAIISDAELWDSISNVIGKIGAEYLGVYEGAVSAYTEFYKKFSDILAKLGGWINPGADGNTVKLDVTKLKNELNTLISAYSKNPPDKSTILVPLQEGTGPVQGIPQEQAEQWIKELGLPITCRFRLSSGLYVVVPDPGPLRIMVTQIDALGKPTNSILELDNAKYQAWQAGFKAQEENLKTTLQTLTQKYSNSNSLYDNLVKVLSSTISSCLETAKSFLQG